MSYLDIENLYKDQTVMIFKQVWALEKIHGTSAHVCYDPEQKKLILFPGGAKLLSFASLFNYEKLYGMMAGKWGDKKVTLYGEHYGGAIMGKENIYGPGNAFVLFDVKIGDFLWLSFDKVQKLGEELGLDVVPGCIVDATLEALDIQRMQPSEQCMKRGITEPRLREGIVIRPLVEFHMNNGGRVIAKYKNEAFRETLSPRTVKVRPEQQVVLTEADNIADEWVTAMRMTHVLDKLGNPSDDKSIPLIIKAMQDDIMRESTGEAVISPEACKAIARKTVGLYQDRRRKNLKEGLVSSQL